MLSDQEKADVIMYLGWPAKTIVPGSTDFSNVVTRSFEDLTVPIEAQTRGLLSRIKNIDSTLIDATSRVMAKKVDTIEINNEEMPMLRKERRKILRELSQLLSIELLAGGGVNIPIRL